MYKRQLPGGAGEFGPLLVDGEARLRQSGGGENPAGGVLAAGGPDRLGTRTRQAQPSGEPGGRRKVVVAGRDHPVEAQHAVQPLHLGQQGLGVVGVGGDHMTGAEQRVRGPLGRRAQVVVQIPGEERELVPAFPDRAWQQPAHRADPALDHQQMTHNSPFRSADERGPHTLTDNDSHCHLVGVTQATERVGKFYPLR